MIFEELSGSKSSLARCVSAELRARMAALRVSGKYLACKSGMSQNYLATRLRDEKPFTLEDVDALIEALDIDVDPHRFIFEAVERNRETVSCEMENESKRRKSATVHQLHSVSDPEPKVEFYDAAKDHGDGPMAEQDGGTDF